ncbi:Hydroxyproline O-galactosyltransferase [Actinidia chinensis var. chinensis]|uniref:Hydroxyproline O-galactosyltransferase n=1 Tax=Actinidia chinensis var. chinensis TaxID=1590841 RepID=A0A2R6PWL0_ACTCC|nr:Hydroxyproline O-galactosyltransferase [Actinidia chinensis var. chinensis]
MKKWSGGMLILGFATILVLCYSFIGKQPQKQSAYDFFNNHPPDDSAVTSSRDRVNSSNTEVKIVQINVKKKPRRVVVEGLSDLYTLKNISKEESKVLLVWAHMRSLLSRSDALPETGQGVKEAAIAWKELLSVVEEEKAYKFLETRNNSNIPGHKDCRYSVSAFNTTISSSGNVLQIPCGLVEDSSITVIGIPDGHRARFEIELVGSRFPEEATPPVILHYNVSVPGDNVTEEPVIVQNTWTKELGWGKEERCPNHRSSNSPKIDQLTKCNEQVVRRIAEENLNASHPNSDKATNVSDGSAHASTNFPFVEGNPFTATLWVGLEGFHMTVNGRHETSFAYRKNLEPWLVSGVKVAGGVDLISALAKGLPVSEDLDLMVDVEQLKAPPISTKRLVLLIGIFSTGNNFERRMALRRSWMQYEPIRSGNVAVRFFSGLDKNKHVNFQLWKEAQAYGDIQLMPFVDYYSLLTLKTIAICILGTKVLPATYIMKMDDDAFVRIDEVISSLKGKVSNGLLYGLIAFESSPQRDKDNKWYISAEEWPHESYPPWAHGPGYIISQDIAKFIVQGHQERDLQLFKLEDVAVGIWIEEFKNQGHKVQHISDDRFYNAGCEPNYILAHYQNPRKVLCLWERLQKDQKPECCE